MASDMEQALRGCRIGRVGGLKQKSPSGGLKGFECGALARIRTLDPLIKSQLLYQLSYECKSYFAGAAGSVFAGAGTVGNDGAVGRLLTGSDAGTSF